MKRKPNAIARQVMSRAADTHASLSDMFEQLADITRGFAIGLREGDTAVLMTIGDNDDLMARIEKAKRDIVSELQLLKSADPEWFEEFNAEYRWKRIKKMGPNELLIEMLAHTAECRNEQCPLHRMIDKRIKELERGK